MDVVYEIVLECLMGLADFDEKKYKPFGFRYWLGWLGITVNLLLLALLACVTAISFLRCLQDKTWREALILVFLLPVTLFWCWKTTLRIRKMWQVTRFYQRIR